MQMETSKLIKKPWMISLKVSKIYVKKDPFHEIFFWISEIRSMPIAIHQSDANEQHYEVPSDFYLKFMGPYMKYSCGYWPNENTTLNESETIMLDMYCERAQLENGNIV